jgi:hypothetical protein
MTMSFLLRVHDPQLDEAIVPGGGLGPKRVRSEKEGVRSEE